MQILPERFNSPTEGSLVGLPVGITYDCAFIHILSWPDSQNKAWPNKTNQPLTYRFLAMPKTKLQEWSNVPSLKCSRLMKLLLFFSNTIFPYNSWKLKPMQLQVEFGFRNQTQIITFQTLQRIEFDRSQTTLVTFVHLPESSFVSALGW